MSDDLISRQAAIDAVRETLPALFSAYQHNVYIHKQIVYIDKQEVMIRLIALPSSLRWTPVTERLPKHFGRYLVTFVPDAGELWTKVDFAMFSDLMGIKKKPIFWNGSVGKPDFENVTKYVTAWMPLPEPWKGGTDVKV